MTGPNSRGRPLCFSCGLKLVKPTLGEGQSEAQSGGERACDLGSAGTESYDRLLAEAPEGADG